MAKKDKEEKEIKRKKGIKTYYAKFSGYTFDVPVVDENGVVRNKMNNQNQPILDSDGNTVPVHRSYKFTNVCDRVSQGFLSAFKFDQDDESAQNIKLGETLEKLHLDETLPKVLSEDKYKKETNYDAYVKEQEVELLKEQLGKANEVIAEMNTPEALQKRLDELTKA